MHLSSDRDVKDFERGAVTKEFQARDVLPQIEDSWALIILWSAREPHRIGEVALLHGDGVEWVLGRSPSDAAGSSDGFSNQSERPVTFFRQRPLGLPDSGSPDEGSQFVLGEGISRRQLSLTPTADGLSLRNIGRCPLLINGQPTSTGLAPLGATIQLQNQLLLYCTRRPTVLPKIEYFPARCVRRFGEADSFGLVGESPAAWLLRERLAVLAQGTANVLIIGESGSGKELAAQTIHGLSSRANRPLVSTNIAAIAPGLAAVQLFGNRRGFPESKMPETKGLVGAADGSTLFLDEVGDMPIEVQPMFLRVTDEGREYQRLGEEDKPPRSSDFRLVGATNRPEQMRIELGRRFPRSAQVPALQDRREDIPLLLMHLLREYRRKGDSEVERFFAGNQPQLHAAFVEYLINHPYQTHVAEIGTLLGQAMAASRGRSIDPPASWFCQPRERVEAAVSRPSLPPPIAPRPAAITEPPLSANSAARVRELRDRIKSVTEAERLELRTLIEASYRQAQGDFSKTAESLGLNRYQLYRLLARLKWKPVRTLTLGSSASE